MHAAKYSGKTRDNTYVYTCSKPTADVFRKSPSPSESGGTHIKCVSGACSPSRAACFKWNDYAGKTSVCRKLTGDSWTRGQPRTTYCARTQQLARPRLNYMGPMNNNV